MKYNSIIWCVTSFCIVLGVVACTSYSDSGETLKTDTLFELPDDCNFMDVHSGAEQYKCSPKLKDKYFNEFSGILINAPKSVVWPKNASLSDYTAGPSGTSRGPLRLMLTGLTRFNYSEMDLDNEANNQVLVIAVNQKTAKSYAGKMHHANQSDAAILDQGRKIIEPNKAEQNRLLTTYFNLDLVHDLNLPIANAHYTVYAMLGEYKSNIIEIETRIKD